MKVQWLEVGECRQIFEEVGREFLSGHTGCGKSRAAREFLPQALKRGLILNDLTARVELVPFPNMTATDTPSFSLLRHLCNVHVEAGFWQ
jgi:hypothetical protein